MNPGIVSLAPVTLTLLLTFYSRNIILALFAGVFAGGILLDSAQGTLFAGINGIAAVFESSWSAKAILFVLMTGSLVQVIEQSGGVKGFVRLLTVRQRAVKSAFGAEVLAYLLGMVLFVDTTVSIVVRGVAIRPLYDTHKGNRETLSYIIDSTSASVAFLSPATAAGAFLAALLGVQISTGVIGGDPFSLVLRAVPFQVYPMVSIVIAGGVIVGRRKVAAAGAAEPGRGAVPHAEGSPDAPASAAVNMLLPLGLFIVGVFGLVVLTGDGSTSIFTGILLTLAVTGVFYRIRGVVDTQGYIAWCVQGMASYLEIALVLTLSFALSNLLNQLGTGAYLAGFGHHVHPALVPAMVFVSGALISFMSGTGGGTLSILVPIAIPLAAALGLSVPLILGACGSGAVFGDHCSPLSDTTILSAKVAGVDGMDHVRAQMPFALTGGVISFLMFLALGFFL
ncbi:Na+/H+ antiporter NhaC family protein [Desulfoluna butyratoxydans]|uniref:Na+/h+ antiporter nhac-like c-terminal n=1 Tax=Desulfoluna butyratoxydans TaxID=231438 RepID=A0A4U8YSB4_9BACT|nr:Na+/H+ antiporter NhaC family protein [Desulfoluna butyratoxydans]VFQ46397.1 na+/h+ antiporter nhac-like c-terminal [Desulfoluna butyratoxydans]